MRQLVRVAADGTVDPVLDLGRPPVVFPPIRRRRPVYLSGVGCPATDELEAAGADIGLLLQPDTSSLHGRALGHRVWAADNGCFSKGAEFDLMAWIIWVNDLTRPAAGWCAWGERPFRDRVDPADPDQDAAVEDFGCLFVNAPDVFDPATGRGDPAGTWERSAPVFEWVRMLGFPVGLVAQDGAEGFGPMWDNHEEWDALFVGGSTAWKLSEDAHECVREAQRLGKWTHMGRVNSFKRLELAASWDVDSVDGTYLAYGPRTNGPKLAAWLQRLESAPALF